MTAAARQALSHQGRTDRIDEPFQSSAAAAGADLGV